MNNKEILTGVFAVFGAIVFMLIGILINVFFGLDFLLIYFLFVFSFILLGYLVLYLKIQHNFEKKYFGLNRSINQLDNNLNNIYSNGKEELFTKLNQGFDEQKNIHAEIVDFFESLLKYLEDDQNERSDSFEDIGKNFEDIGKNFEDIGKNFEDMRKELDAKFLEQKDIQKKMASGVEDLFSSQYKQIQDVDKKWNDFVKLSKAKSSRKK
jgi:hypothetical protein